MRPSCQTLTGPTPEPPRLQQTVAAVVPVRIRHVDSLRAIAAGLVVWTHFAEVLAPLSRRNPPLLDFLWTLPPALNLGRVGVLIFFAVSGFVIRRSFGGPREGGARRFAIKRLCRLYPAFAVSLLGGILVWRLRDIPLTWRMLAANATMAPGLFGQTPLLGQYWTLALEMFFYALCLGLYAVNALDRRVVQYGAALCLAALPKVLHRTALLFGAHYHLPDVAITWTLCLSVMFWGAVFRTEYDETGGFRRTTHFWRGATPLALLTVALPYLAYPGITWAPHVFVELPWHDQILPVCALVVFALWVGVLRVDQAILTFLGVISYSWYLFHPFVLDVFISLFGNHRLDFPLWVTLPVCIACSVPLAALIHARVERPGIAFGKHWAGAFRPPALRMTEENQPVR